ncbi:MAG: cysteine desulfurase [Gammaproteobacteria bacterium]|nr:cysteine desulfurase [Gammaproteobacteria bacterium]
MPVLSSADIQKIRQDFPILQTKVNAKPLIYFDNAASTQKPKVVIDAVSSCYEKNYSNVHRGVHYLSAKATELFESARDTVQNFINAKHREEIIFVRGTTEAINLVAQTYGRANIKSGDEIIISTMEHHSNIVPWQMLCEQTGAVLKVAPINQQGEIIFEEFEKLLNNKTKLVAVSYVSNTLGTINPVEKIITSAHEKDIPVLLDAAQAVSHMTVDVQKLDCDFLVFSGHKLYGPTGIGILYGKKEYLEKMPPYQGGGEMISQVTFEKTTYNVIPHKFEAGTPDVSGAIGLASAIHYVKSIGLNNIHAYENQLLQYISDEIAKYSDIKIIGTAKHKTSIVSFVFDSIHAHDVGTILDQEGVAIRTGHHCTMPLMHFYKVPATSRASLAFYNTPEEVDVFIKSLSKVRQVFDV